MINSCRRLFLCCLALQAGLNLLFTALLLNSAAAILGDVDFILVGLVIGGVQIGASVILGYFMRRRYGELLLTEQDQRKKYAVIVKVAIVLLLWVLLKPNTIGSIHVRVIGWVYALSGLEYSFTAYDFVSLAACLGMVFLGGSREKALQEGNSEGKGGICIYLKRK